MLSNKEIVCPNNLLDHAHKKKGVNAAIVNAGLPLPMLSVQDAVNENLITPIFIGDKDKIIKCAEDLKWDISSYYLVPWPDWDRRRTWLIRCCHSKSWTCGSSCASFGWLQQQDGDRWQGGGHVL